MGLTRIRAEQISDIDYKQAVRVISTSNVNLTGGAPSQVDGVTLNAKDRILVAGQSLPNQNGLYDVTVVGTGSDGTWVRTNDSNTTGEINAGMIVMVTEGNDYADTSWKLITDDPIVIGVTALTFLQNTGNSFSIINVVGSANVVANGVSSTVAFASGNNFSITGNATTDTITFNVSQNPSFTGNVSGANILTGGLISATGNVYGNSFITSGGGGGISASGNIQAGNVLTAGVVSATGNAIVGNLSTAGNITASYYFGNGSQLASLNGANIFGNISTTGNITGGNLLTVGLASVGGNITANNITTGNVISAAGNIFGGGIRSTTSATPPSNPSVGDFWYNTTTNAQYRFTFDGTDYFWLDDYGSTIGVDGIFSQMSNGNSNISINAPGGNISMSVGGTSNVAIINSSGNISAIGTVIGSALRINTSYTPSGSSSPGVVGQITWDANFIYVCVSANTWARATLNTW